jgi:predicted nuclease of predicted toxin-antitoxin system
MKLLFDQNLSFRLCQNTADLFPELNHVRLLGLSEAGDRMLRAGNQSTAAVSTLIRRHVDLIVAFGHDDDTACLEIC